MKLNLSKYFWDLNKKALKETKNILKDRRHPKFRGRWVAFLSRCDKPKELFSLISKKEFIEFWPKIKNYWRKISKNSDFRDWWETIYEQIKEEYRIKSTKKPKGKAPSIFFKIGGMIRRARNKKGLNQSELAWRVGMKQPDISAIEDGKKNITLETLTALCKVLNLKKIEL